MFPYKSAVGFFIIQILKALALIKAGRIYPVSCYRVSERRLAPLVNGLKAAGGVQEVGLLFYN